MKLLFLSLMLTTFVTGTDSDTPLEYSICDIRSLKIVNEKEELFKGNYRVLFLHNEDTTLDLSNGGKELSKLRFVKQSKMIFILDGRTLEIRDIGRYLRDGSKYSFVLQILNDSIDCVDVKYIEKTEVMIDGYNSPEGRIRCNLLTIK